MRRVLALSSLVMIASVFMAAPVLAEKRLDVMLMSNGYPSGPHYNLNIHGKDTATFSCDITHAGSSVFISEYGRSTIEYVWNKKASFVTELTVLDACGSDGRQPEPPFGWPAPRQRGLPSRPRRETDGRVIASFPDRRPAVAAWHPGCLAAAFRCRTLPRSAGDLSK